MIISEIFFFYLLLLQFISLILFCYSILIELFQLFWLFIHFLFILLILFLLFLLCLQDFPSTYFGFPSDASGICILLIDITQSNPLLTTSQIICRFLHFGIHRKNLWQTSPRVAAEDSVHLIPGINFFLANKHFSKTTLRVHLRCSQEHYPQ